MALAPPAPTSAPRRTRIGVGLVLLLSALTAIGPLTFDTYLAAFPDIAVDLGATSAAVQLTLTASLAGLAIGQLLIGSLSDTFGRRRPLLVALGVYVLTSSSVVVVETVAALTALRFVQGLAAAAGMVLSMAMVRDRFEGVDVSRVMARLMLVVGVAPVLAPTIGAQLLTVGSWRLIFGFLAVVGLALLVLAATTLRETLPRELRRTGGTRAALGAYAGLLTDRSFMGLALLSATYMGALFTYVSASTFVFQGGYGLDAQQFGWVFAAGAAGITVGSQVCGALVNRFRPEQILTGAIVGGLVTAAALVTVTLAGAPFWPTTALLVLMLTTAGFVMPSAPAIALAGNPHRAGSAAALLGALQFGLGAVIAPLTSIGGTPTVTRMAVVMAALAVTSAVLLVPLRRTWSRAELTRETGPVRASRAVTGSSADVDPTAVRVQAARDAT